MPVPVTEAQLAASPGHDPKREVARRSVALEFFKEHLFEADPKKDWNVVRRAMQCIDWGRPVAIGPDPPAPRRLLAVQPGGPLGGGFFAEEAQAAGERAEWWVVAPEAVYLKFYAPMLLSDLQLRAAPSARYFVPGARNPRGHRVASRERG